MQCVRRDTEYLEHTWSITKSWRKRTADEIAKLHPSWDIQGACVPMCVCVLRLSWGPRYN